MMFACAPWAAKFLAATAKGYYAVPKAAAHTARHATVAAAKAQSATHAAVTPQVSPHAAGRAVSKAARQAKHLIK